MNSLAYVRHHYVPQFLLHEWECGTDSKLTVFSRSFNGTLLANRRTAAGIGYEKNLYTTESMQTSERDVSIERDFFGPHIDEHGAIAHKKMLQGGISSMSDINNGYWAQFLVAQYMRVPRTIQTLKQMAREALDEQLNADPDYARVEGLTKTLDTREWVEKYLPQAYDQLSIGGLPTFIQQPRLLGEMHHGRWDIKSIAPSCPFTFLLGDHPLIIRGELSSQFVMALPLTPRKIFFHSELAGTTYRDWFSLSDAAFVKRANLETVAFSSRYVMARDNSQMAFVDRRLRPRPDTQPNDD